MATEAAGEGINLQFCHLMINYDLPWNPTRLEQRLGRIHRIGQERDVYVFNFVASESEEGQPVIEGRILQRLLAKLEQMREVLSDRVFDVIGEVLSLNEINLSEMLREVAFDPRRLEEYLDQIERMDPLKLKAYEKATMPRFYWDFSQAKNYFEKGQTPWTPAVSTVYAMSVALKMLLEEGLPNILDRHARVGKAARDGVKSLGLPLFAEEEYASNTVTSVSASNGLDTKKLLKILREEHELILGGGQQRLDGQIFRIGHLGWVREKDIETVITALKAALPQAGFTPA